MITKIDQLIMYFNSIKTDKIQDQMLANIQTVAKLSQDSKNQLQIELFLDNNHMIEFVEHKNSRYLVQFMNFLTKTDSEEIKEKIMELIQDL
jgi:predicted nucleotidyltransferase